MKIVFLDFDGVINKGAGPWCHDNVRALNLITDRTGAKIVVHSSWRYGRSLDEIRRVLRNHGAPVTGEVIDLAPVPHNAVKRESGVIVLSDEDFARFAKGMPTKWAYERPAAIQRWLDDHPDVKHSDFIILDDCGPPGMAHLNHRFIHTRMNVGLTREQAYKAILMLKPPRLG
jgi:hypothetical protein